VKHPLCYYLKGRRLPDNPDLSSVAAIDKIILQIEKEIESLIEGIEDCELGFKEHRGLDFPEGVAMALLRVECDLKAHEEYLIKLKKSKL